MNLPGILRGNRPGLSPIGLDVGSSRIKAAQLRRRSNTGWTLHAFASIPRAVPGAALDAGEAMRVNDVLFRQGFSGSEVVLAVPDAKLLTANLELPPRSAEIPIDQIARAEFARSVKADGDPFEFAYWDLPAPARAARSTHVMGVGCRHIDADPLIDALELGGFEVMAVDVEAAALTRACGRMIAPPQEITALVDIGESAVRLYVIHQGVVTYCRSLAGQGMHLLREAVAQQIEVKDDPEVIDYVLERVSLADESLASASEQAGASATSSSIAIEQAARVVCSHFDTVLAEVTTSLSYAAHQYPEAPVRRILIAGGGAALGGLADYFTSKLRIETCAVRCADLVEAAQRDGRVHVDHEGDDESDEAAAFSGALAMGLAQFRGSRLRREVRA